MSYIVDFQKLCLFLHKKKDFLILLILGVGVVLSVVTFPSGVRLCLYERIPAEVLDLDAIHARTFSVCALVFRCARSRLHLTSCPHLGETVIVMFFCRICSEPLLIPTTTSLVLFTGFLETPPSFTAAQ